MQGESIPEKSKVPDRVGRGALGPLGLDPGRYTEEPAAMELVTDAAQRIIGEIDALRQDARDANERANLAEKAADIDPQTGLWTPRKFFREINNWAEKMAQTPVRK